MGRSAIGILVRLDKAVGGVEVGKSALRAVERSRALLDDELLLRWFEGGRLGSRLFGVGIGTPDRTVGLYATSAVNQTTLSSHSVFLPTNGENRLVDLLRGCEREQ